MTQREIKRKFEEIVAFAEVGQFIDTPAKRYSSGMYVVSRSQLAAHLEPEILVVDEVLAVGDAAFQKKCLGMTSDVATRNRFRFITAQQHIFIPKPVNSLPLVNSIESLIWRPSPQRASTKLKASLVKLSHDKARPF